MTDISLEEQKLISKAWYNFFQNSIEFDSNNANPHGWSWFWGLYELYHDPYDPSPLEIATIQTKLPEEHWLKKLDNAELKKISDAIHNDENTEEFFYSAYGLFMEVDEIHKPISTAINFSHFTSDKYVIFTNFIFLGRVSFSHTKFSQNANFNNAVFFGDAQFDNIEFSQNANFNSAVFLGDVQFDNIVFSQNANFNKTIFSEIADFYNTKFYGDTDFSKANFTNIAGFRATTFYEFADFSNAKFEGHTTFADAKFKKFTPHFHNAKLSADIIWERYFKFWPQLKEYKHVLKKTEINEILRMNQNAYENLAYQMKDSEKYHDEHFFFRQEMRCRQKLEHVLIKPFYWLYEGLSNYGYGVGFACLWWFVHILIGAGILFGLRAYYCDTNTINDFGCSLGISLSNSHAFFFKGDRLKNCYDTFEYLPAFNVIWGVQTITGTLLLFLLLLTLRIRFRLK